MQVSYQAHFGSFMFGFVSFGDAIGGLVVTLNNGRKATSCRRSRDKVDAMMATVVSMPPAG